MRILIIEDEADISSFLKASLEAEMFAVDVASDGERGLFLARSNEYDLIILDYVLPKLNGEQVLEALRQDNKDLPVLVLTVKSELSFKKSLFSLGADDYLTKPFLFQELKLRIKALLRRPKQTQEEIIQVGDLMLDTRQQIIKRGDKQIYLTRKEFMLLEYLMINKGQVVSRGAILEHAWDINADPFSNSLETHITSLRKKIGRSKGKELIHTFHGRGYKLATNKLNG